MKPYKMKHIPTGLYFQPHKHRGSHLSKNGKIYQTASNGIDTGNYGHKTFTIDHIYLSVWFVPLIPTVIFILILLANISGIKRTNWFNGKHWKK